MKAALQWISAHFYWMRLPSITITPIDIIQILILAWIIYKILAWIKTSHAWSLMKGLVVIGVFVALIYIFQMTTLMYIINQGLGLVIMAAMVIFQPELRKALESLGRRQIVTRLFMPNRQFEQLFSDRTMNEIIRGCEEMARAKTGALIVIEQNDNLSEYERTGIEVDALVTSQLLINIFEKNTPLHDGAVIVREDRVTAATCYLPLSDNMRLSKELGTRHRAGVGISEVTDSLTIIVSEETGRISLAYRGSLERGVTEDRFRDRMIQFQNKSELKRRPIFRKEKSKNGT